MLTHETVKRAVEQGGSARAAAKLLGKSYTAVQWWLARNGYRVVTRATIEPIRFEMTDKARQVVQTEDK